ncbi:hypothetical protein [Streptomyces millisiae]|uniref:Twitching motility protein PilT n=1 Tax=Streptomyces millisiae TaxID=3075542 RepID=A0ABU2LTM9_9ACTN|nr:hypothetical protein [Streptomyces sp. DSM 44918]MDT0320942.1 hypothetical protein [Streptomyces sp. DSM 44918]
MLIVDSGPLVAFLNRNDPDHERCAELLESYDGDHFRALVPDHASAFTLLP